MTLAIQKASEAIVERSRQGDQNAIALICELRENRKQGNRDAVLAYDYMMAYVKKNPVGKSLVKVGTEHSPISLKPISKCLRSSGNAYAGPIVTFVLESMSESVGDSVLMAHALAMGRAIDLAAIRDVMRFTPPPIRPIFSDACRNPRLAIKKAQKLSPMEIKCLQLGYILGMARAIQIAREPNGSLRLLSPSVAWELGE